MMKLPEVPRHEMGRDQAWFAPSIALFLEENDAAFIFHLYRTNDSMTSTKAPLKHSIVGGDQTPFTEC